MYYSQEVVRQLPLVSIKYLLFDNASLYKVTAFAGVVSLYTSTFTVKCVTNLVSNRICVCMAEVSKIYRTNI